MKNPIQENNLYLCLYCNSAFRIKDECVHHMKNFYLKDGIKKIFECREKQKKYEVYVSTGNEHWGNKINEKAASLKFISDRFGKGSADHLKELQDYISLLERYKIQYGEDYKQEDF